jgi:hypothetical protein
MGVFAEWVRGLYLGQLGESEEIQGVKWMQ